MAYNIEIMTEIKNLSSFILSISNMEYGDMIFFYFLFFIPSNFPSLSLVFSVKIHVKCTYETI